MASTAKKNAAGIVANGSGVKVENVKTEGNDWYGINVDRDHSRFEISGTSQHDEEVNIFTDSRSLTDYQFIDKSNQYVRFWQGNGYKYQLDRSKPTAVITAPGNNSYVTNPASAVIKIDVADDISLDRIDVAIYDQTDTIQHSIWGDWIAYNTGQTQTISYAGKLTGLADGVYTLRATIGDKLKKSTDAVSVKFIIDTAAPDA